MFIADPERKEWLQVRMESTRNRPALDPAARSRVLEKVVEAESFERFLHAKYVGHKRFSLEGCESTIPLLDRLLSDAARQGVRESVIGMAHRGRLNVLANTIGKPLAQIFSEFEGQADPDSTQGSGDVKYHLGATGTHHADTGQTLTVSVARTRATSSGWTPVVEGMVRARQDALDDQERAKVLPILLHGDAASQARGSWRRR
jgi:2-oxoglutarate dehydrogenase E1 component